MKITEKWLKSKRRDGFCWDLAKWFQGQRETGLIAIIKLLMSRRVVKKVYRIYHNDSLSWANWLIANALPEIDRIKYNLFAAESVIDIYEAKYPNDNRLRYVIKTIKRYLDNPSEETKTAVAAAHAYAVVIANAADTDAYNTCADDYDAAPVFAAYAVVAAAATAIDIYDDTDSVVFVADCFSNVKKRECLIIKILKYGIKLLKGE